MLTRPFRSLMMIIFVIAIATFVSYSVYISAQDAQNKNKPGEPVEIEIANNAINVANRITGLNELSNVRIAASEVTIAEAEDDTPLVPVRKKIINRPLWKVSYEVNALELRDKKNPHIVGFDVYIDKANGQLLKIVSRDAPGLPEEYRKGFKVSNQEIASHLDHNRYWDPNQLPLIAPRFRFIDIVKNKKSRIIARHHECYYFLYKPNEAENIPAWFNILYGTEPPPSIGGPAVAELSGLKIVTPSLAERYTRTFRMGMINAMSGDEVGVAAFAQGTNEDTFTKPSQTTK